MAVTQNPLIGRSRQSAGGMTFTTWRGRNVIKTKPLTVADPKTERQVANRAAMRVLNAALRPNLAVIRVGYVENSKNNPGWSQAISVNRKDAVTVTPPTATLDATLVTLSKGSLLSSDGFAAAVNGANVDLTWKDNSNGITGFSTDLLAVGAVDPATGLGLGSLVTAFTRADASGSINAAATVFPVGSRMIAFFVSADGSRSSDSVNVLST